MLSSVAVLACQGNIYYLIKDEDLHFPLSCKQTESAVNDMKKKKRVTAKDALS